MECGNDVIIELAGDREVAAHEGFGMECGSGKMDDDTMEKANMAIKLLRIGSGRYSAETNRMALAFRLARTLEVPKQELVPLWRQLAGSEAAERAQKAIESAQADAGASAPVKKGK